MSGIWTERDPSKDETQIGDQKALSLRTIHFLILKIFYIHSAGADSASA